MHPLKFDLGKPYLLVAMLLVLLTTVSVGESARGQPEGHEKGKKLWVVATTTLVGDVVRAVGGDTIKLTVLLPVGTDPHTFEPTPQNMAAVADADVVFVNGAGLEEFLEPLLENAGSKAKVVSVSDGIALRKFEGGHAYAHEPKGEHEPSGIDPHVWFDPNNVIRWVKNIKRTLNTLDSTNTEVYTANARKYEAALQELDGWIREQVARVPQTNRKLVTDHAVFGYFADRYGFKQVGAVFPGFSTLAEPSAQDRAELEQTIIEFHIKAIFVGKTVNLRLAQQVAKDTGTQLVLLYTGSLSESGGPADSYLSFMRYNVSTIVDALQ